MSNHQQIQQLLSAYECGLVSLEQATEVEMHVVECDSCFEDLYQFSLASQEIKRQRQQIQTVRVKRFEVRRYLIAAVIFITALAGVLIHRFTTVTEQSVLRGSEAIEIQSPAEGEPLALPVRFRWTDRSDSDKYVIYIYDTDGKLIHQQTLASTEYLWKGNTKAQPGTYRWKINAFLNDGTLTASSKISELRLK